MNAKLGSDGRLTLSGWLLNQLDSPDFAWRTKNLLWDELNVLKRKLNVKIKNTIDDLPIRIKYVSLKSLLEVTNEQYQQLYPWDL
jgi:pantothenate kinase-related protein Tda10